MKNMIRGIGAAMIAGVVLLVLSSCDVQTITNSYDVYGSAMDVTQTSNFGSGFTGASVSLSGSNGNFATTIDGSGYFSFYGVPSGRYTLNGSSAAWAFVPQTVDIIGANSTLPNLLALPATSPAALTVVMVWENRSVDMDLHMTWGGGPANNDDATNHIYFNNKTDSGTGWSAALKQDVIPASNNDPLVETITISATGGPISETFKAYVSSTKDYTIFPGNNFTTDAPAGVTLHVFQAATHLGSFTAPYNTGDTILRMCRIVIATPNFTLSTEMQSANSFTGIKSLTSLPVAGVKVSHFGE